MIELEELSNLDIKEESEDMQKLYSKSAAQAKAMILSQMLENGKDQISTAYLKKSLLSRSGDTTFVNQLLKNFSKLIKMDVAKDMES